MNYKIRKLLSFAIVLTVPLAVSRARAQEIGLERVEESATFFDRKVKLPDGKVVTVTYSGTGLAQSVTAPDGTKTDVSTMGSGEFKAVAAQAGLSEGKVAPQFLAPSQIKEGATTVAADPSTAAPAPAEAAKPVDPATPATGAPNPSAPATSAAPAGSEAGKTLVTKDQITDLKAEAKGAGGYVIGEDGLPHWDAKKKLSTNAESGANADVKKEIMNCMKRYLNNKFSGAQDKGFYGRVSNIVFLDANQTAAGDTSTAKYKNLFFERGKLGSSTLYIRLSGNETAATACSDAKGVYANEVKKFLDDSLTPTGDKKEGGQIPGALAFTRGPKTGEGAKKYIVGDEDKVSNLATIAGAESKAKAADSIPKADPATDSDNASVALSANLGPALQAPAEPGQPGAQAPEAAQPPGEAQPSGAGAAGASAPSTQAAAQPPAAKPAAYVTTAPEEKQKYDQSVSKLTVAHENFEKAKAAFDPKASREVRGVAAQKAEAARVALVRAQGAYARDKGALVTLDPAIKDQLKPIDAKYTATPNFDLKPAAEKTAVASSDAQPAPAGAKAAPESPAAATYGSVRKSIAKDLAFGATDDERQGALAIVDRANALPPSPKLATQYAELDQLQSQAQPDRAAISAKKSQILREQALQVTALPDADVSQKAAVVQRIESLARNQDAIAARASSGSNSAAKPDAGFPPAASAPTLEELAAKKAQLAEKIRAADASNPGPGLSPLNRAISGAVNNSAYNAKLDQQAKARDILAQQRNDYASLSRAEYEQKKQKAIASQPAVAQKLADLDAREVELRTRQAALPAKKTQESLNEVKEIARAKLAVDSERLTAMGGPADNDLSFARDEVLLDRQLTSIQLRRAEAEQLQLSYDALPKAGRAAGEAANYAHAKLQAAQEDLRATEAAYKKARAEFEKKFRYQAGK